VNTKICLSFTNYHPEYWQPAWTIESILLAIVSFMPVEEEIPGVGAMNLPSKVRQDMAKNSHSWTCKTCQMSNAVIARDFMSNDENDHEKAQEELRKAKEMMPLNLTSEAEKQRRIE
jgi:hypothetical protein